LFPAVEAGAMAPTQTDSTTARRDMSETTSWTVGGWNEPGRGRSL
jgi:hypothetical protein